MRVGLVHQPPRKVARGQNKARPYSIVTDEHSLCTTVAAGRACSYGAQCRFSHDIQLYLRTKPADLGDRCLLFDKYGRYGNPF